MARWSMEAIYIPESFFHDTQPWLISLHLRAGMTSMIPPETSTMNHKLIIYLSVFCIMLAFAITF